MKKVLALLLLTFSAFAQTQHKVILTWGASPTSGVTYDVYRATTAGACGTTPLATGITSLTYTDATVISGSTYFYAVDASGSGGKSACTNEVQVLIPVPPQPPTNLGATVQ